MEITHFLKRKLLPKSQKLGRSLMLPVSVLPAAAIMVGIGYWMETVGLGESTFFSRILIAVGMIILENIPILFAAGVALGMSKDRDGTAVLSGVLCYLVIIRVLSPESIGFYNQIEMTQVSLAFFSVGNQFTGIISGLVAAFIYNRFYNTRLPEGISFFSGKRLVPILSVFTIIPVSFLLYFIWPLVYEGLIIFGSRISSLGALGAGIYGFFNRLLIPLGLHHPLNSVFWFDVIGINDIGSFWGSIGTRGETGMYMAGFFPIMMFGLPGAALAMARCARKGQKTKTKSFMYTSSIASFLTGITEPLEFSFMYQAPRLYLLHSFYTGLSLYLAAEFKWIAGFSFSAGLTDFLLSVQMPFAKDMDKLIMLGIFFFFLYYFSFTFIIQRYNVLTPGREVQQKKKESSVEVYNTNYRRTAKQIIRACGGKNNILSADACITRLRLEVKKSSIIREENLKKLGALGVFNVDENVQIIIGPQVNYILEEMKEMLKGRI
ncbi:MAG: PTS transporter subunit EIIC [Clostridium sp.]|nr:PTS transporter subunit EIIC [Clostridium sp.]